MRWVKTEEESKVVWWPGGLTELGDAGAFAEMGAQGEGTGGG